MNNLQKIFFFIFLSNIFQSAIAQFNTVFPKIKSEDETETAIKLNNNLSAYSDNDKGEMITILDSLRNERDDIIHKRKYLSLPIDTIIETSHYGMRRDPFTGKSKFHNGIDMAADYNYVYAIMPGKVIKSGKDKGFGKFIAIECGEFDIFYGHLSQNLVSKNEAVVAGTVIGISGNSGRSTGEHLHFEIRYRNKPINPVPILTYIQKVVIFTRKELGSTFILYGQKSEIISKFPYRL